jgi:hypothetical protein
VSFSVTDHWHVTDFDRFCSFDSSATLNAAGEKFAFF